MTLLSVENLAIDLTRGSDKHRLVSDASWKLDAGETIAIVGESGSGKSLTALAVMGLLADELAPVAGKILFEGKNLLKASAEEMRQLRGQEIAMVFQEPMTSLNPVKTIGYQLAEGVRHHFGLSSKEARARALTLLDQVGISDAEHRLKQYPHQLSGGMRQRVMIAIALACKPKLILADEATTALDVTIQAQILTLLSSLCKEQSVGLVLITHNLGIVARYAKRVVVMYGGRVIEEADASQLYSDPRHPYTQGLLLSVPRMDTSREQALQPIAGTPPDPFEIINGCRFNPRCRYASDQCRSETPQYKRDTAHSVACWNWLEIAQEAKLSNETRTA
ncbi:MAG: oligopeptide/dipeptide ABC transporter ATP-binding protein [Porticoccaceae bacterium]|jgi:oligopeptide/dipeptide ABC transporter ATP-binding protein